jgi:hypothetical protein
VGSCVLGPNQGFQQVLQVWFDAFTEYKTMVAREFARVIATPQDQIMVWVMTTSSSWSRRPDITTP